MSPHPLTLALSAPNRLRIEWSDGLRREYGCRELRDACPCATCREQRKAAPAAGLLMVLKPEEVAPLTFRGMQPVGRYAYHIDFSDGHDTGIYPLELLHELGQEVTP